MFVRFLQGKYGDFAKLATAWGDKDAKDIASFADLRYPSDKSEAYKKAGAARKADIDEFWKQYADQAVREEDENV